MLDYKPVETPMEPGLKFCKDRTGNLVNKETYQSLPQELDLYLEKNQNRTVKVYTVASWGGELTDRRSISGYCAYVWDSETVLHELDPAKVYIVGRLVDRNRWKGITMKKAEEQGIRTAKFPIGDSMKMSSSQLLTVNQVIEILLKFLETKDWKASFFHVVPQRCLEVLSHD
ncbi:tRNA methyltransferase 10 homolog A-like [Hibiscus syriacus]|uniref:tRNA methyltransferase 10 homolog A-like n=1 Tax=Hibiscus syriacus TaxID=106335 RepID=UPI001923BCE5|nr:tRNA methyltransferase 10 homolog A-like [Hibiscus syriacus]